MRLIKLFLAATLAAVTTFAFADALTDRARQLLRDRQHQQAYQLLLPQEPNRAGDPEFDYLLGIAAIDAGDPERGIFALERVLALQPNNHVARAEIARAYLAVGERQAARREFEAVRNQQIPADAKSSIDRYLQAIASADVTQVTGYYELGAGYDSNVNSATGSSQIAIPAIGIVTLDPTTTSREDLFASLAGGVNVTHKLSQSWAVVGGFSALGRIHPQEEAFNTTSIDLNLGARYSVGKEAITVGAQAQHFTLSANTFRRAIGGIAQWQHSFTERQQLSLFGQFLELTYPTQSIRDADRAVVGLAYGHAFSGNLSPVLFASVYGGQEKEQSTGVPHLGHDLAGIRVGGQVRVATGVGLFANASYEQREYGGLEPLFGVDRKDEQADLQFGVSYLLRASTVLLFQVALTDVQSNVPINDFDRAVTGVYMRTNF